MLDVVMKVTTSYFVKIQNNIICMDLKLIVTSSVIRNLVWGGYTFLENMNGHYQH